MSELVINPEDANGYIVIIATKSFEAKARKIFGITPDIRVTSYNKENDQVYQIVLTLPPRKYLYEVEIEQLRALGVKVVALRAIEDRKLAVYLELSLDKYLVGLTKENPMLLGHTKTEAPEPPAKEQKTL